MKRLLLVILLVICFHAIGAEAAIYYISASGSDSNNGTSKTTPWLHAPGMSGCSSNCASHTPSAGNNYILRGGDTWNVTSSWNWTWSGTSGSRIYVGVDNTWYTGGSWARPKLNGGNSLSTSAVGSCTRDWNGSMFIYLNADYVTFDNIEFLGMCWTGSPGYANTTYFSRWGTYDILSNLYFHGWTHTAFGGGTTDGATAITGATNGELGTGNQVAYVTVDGSDSDRYSLFGLYGDCYDVHNSTFRYAANGLVCNNGKTFHDNLVEYIYNSNDPGTHSNALEYNSQYSGTAGTGTSIYNNIFRHIYSAVGVWTCDCGNDYFYNNVLYDMNTNPLNISQGWECVSSHENSGPGTLTLYNNTFVNIAIQTPDSTPNWAGSAVNNHYINSTMAAGMSGSNTSYVSQTASQATAQGYAAANNYAPASGGSTVNAGSSSPSSIFTTDILGVSRPQGSAWDIGAYEYAPGFVIRHTVTLNIVTPVGGSHLTITPSTPQSIPEGASTSFSVVPDAGYTATVTGCGGTLINNTYYTGIITGDCTITASAAVIINATVGGTVSGLTGTVVTRLVVSESGVYSFEAITITANGLYQYPTTHPVGTTYQALISTQPTGQTCTIYNSSGTIVPLYNVVNVNIICVTNTTPPPPVEAGSLSNTISGGTFDGGSLR